MKNKPLTSEAPLEVVEPGAGGSAPVAPGVPGSALDEAAPTLRDYVDTVREARWTILGMLLVALVGGVAFWVFVPPTYVSDAVVQVEEMKITIAGVENLASMANSQSLADTETEILRSRMLVGSIVDDLRLDVVARPHHFPLLGGGIARRYDSDGPAPPLLGLSSFAWGGEAIDVAQLQVPPRWMEKTLTLVAGEQRRFEVLDPKGRVLGQGEVGVPFRASGVELLVTTLTARPATRFDLERFPREEVVEKLQKSLQISEKGRRTGVIAIRLKGPDPAVIAAVLNSLSRAYLRQNVERRSAEAENTLQFISGQLPRVKANLDKAEAALNEYRQHRGGGLDLGVETKAALDRAAVVERMLTENEMQRSEYRQRFTESHPAVAALNRKTEQLKAERAELDRQLKGLPETELHAARLTRDAKAASELYVLLLNKSQELQVMKSGTIGNVRIVDAAPVPEKPVSPLPGITLAVSALIGVALGIAGAFVRKALDRTVTDPEAIERATGLPVYATVPHSPAQQRVARAVRAAAPGEPAILAASQPDDLAVEALRSLRTSLQFALTGARNNVVTITGPSPGTGKSFVAVNLAHVLASAGMRVLLVDADMRRGRLHHDLATERSPGLADVIRGTVSIGEAIRTGGAAGVHFVPAGKRPPNPSELLSSTVFGEVLAFASHRYDLVLVDTPPVLAVTDGALVARTAATNLLVLKAGEHPLREIATAVKLLTQNGATPRAIILNDVMPSASYGYSRYDYR